MTCHFAQTVLLKGPQQWQWMRAVHEFVNDVRKETFDFAEVEEFMYDRCLNETGRPLIEYLTLHEGKQLLEILVDHHGDFQMEFDSLIGEDFAPDYVLFHTGGNMGAGGNTVEVVSIVQLFLLRFDPTSFWTLEFAVVTEDPDPGQFGGGYAFVTASKVEWFNPQQWVQDRISNHAPAV